MNLFKPKTADEQPDAKLIRDGLLQFIKEQLAKLEGGEGGNVRALHLFIACSDAEKYLYEAAVYFDEKDRFKQDEVQRIADNYAIDLTADWNMVLQFTDALPDEAVKVPGLDAGLFIQTSKRNLQKSATAYLKVLNGEAEKAVYTIHSSDGKITIGREKETKSADGFFRINTIAFNPDSPHESNKFVSRQHAHIQFDPDTGQFLLFPDEGGIPPRNKVKVRSVNDEAPVKLYSTKIGHTLQEGDQIMLGESALLAFSYFAEK